MEPEHIITDNGVKQIALGLKRHEHWLAYNSVNYYISKEDVYTFKTKDEADEFALHNVSEFDCYNITHALTLKEAVQQLKADENIDITFHSTIKQHVMDEKTMAFNQAQLNKAGFQEAFTQDLVAKMNQGQALIQHKFEKSYDEDKVTAMLHLKKSSNSDNYFLNKFDVSLQKQGQADSIQQTFYINRKPDAENNQAILENKYTLKEAYNLLSGRAVHKNLINNEGQGYEAWVKLNLKNKLENGNFEMKQYTKNYGFELENVLSKYPIKELTNETYKNSLMDSLQRGNLQKATFVDKDGKEEKLFISPNITLNALNVYDLEKQRIPTEKLVEKNYIGKEMGEKISALINKTKEANTPATSQKEVKKNTPAKVSRQKVK
jgi:hypothetical protein